MFLGITETIVGLLVVVWVSFSVYSIFCITSFGDWTNLQHQETT